MNIELTKGYKVGTKFFTTLAEAQKESLATLLKDAPLSVDSLVSKSAEVVAILSPPKELRMRATRKDKGTKRARAAQTSTPTPASK